MESDRKNPCWHRTGNSRNMSRLTKGSHEIWYNPRTRRRTTVPHHPGVLPLGTLRAIIREAGLTVREFLSAGEPSQRTKP
ncbi:TPA: type II toxin-antitoxin system HicA family toxin [Candidatus Poribacteria bacterium]|nr:type II toxin-antitoxin system HicA family toxin [Candidatus Poribacteria bacterium]HEX29197.1 type II toxin-antitoxin system HicA family toxin [Candidatus Poribacteria bacterium]